MRLAALPRACSGTMVLILSRRRGREKMTELWKQSEGQIVDGVFHLRQYLGAGENSAVFLTEYGERKPLKAAIKLVLPEPLGAELQLFRWEMAAKLSHPHLIRLFQMGRCQLNGATLLYV